MVFPFRFFLHHWPFSLTSILLMTKQKLFIEERKNAHNGQWHMGCNDVLSEYYIFDSGFYNSSYSMEINFVLFRWFFFS